MSRGHQEHPARPMGHHDDHGHDHGHGHGHGHGDHAAHGSMKDYVTGFVLAVILTAIPFWMVMHRSPDSSVTSLGIILLALGAVQIVVHIKYFLHMNSKSEGGWNMLAMIFTIILVVIALSGSLWVMYHMNHNMMPTMSPENMPTETVPQSMQQSMQGMPGMQQPAK